VSADSRRRLILLGLVTAVAVYVALRIAAVYTVAFNWDELALLARIARSLDEGQLHSGGRPGLTELVLAPLVSGCQDEIATARSARLLWLPVTLLYLGGLGVLLWQLLGDRIQRLHDVLLGVALLALLPAFLEWSIQVRTDQLALAGGIWGGVALLASVRRPGLALAAGACFGVGLLASQKLVYVAALMLLLAGGSQLLSRDWRPRREVLRAGLALAGLVAVSVGFRALASAGSMPVNEPLAVRIAGAGVVQGGFDVFHFYRNTIGYSQYVALLPTLVPHVGLLALLVIASAHGVRSRDEDRRCGDDGARRNGDVLLPWAVLALGLVVAAVHAAAFAYFWMTLGLFPAVGLALALGPIRTRLPARPPALAQLAIAAIWLALALPGALQMGVLLRDTQAVQRESLAFVHRNFAGDDVGFHPEGGVFCGAPQPLGVWFSQSIYRQFEGPQRDRTLGWFLHTFREKPLHYIVQSFRLNQFPAELRRFWADNYQPYRASVFVAGRHLEGTRGESSALEIVVPGRYRWLPFEGRQAVRIDDRRLEPGALVDLDAGEHRATLVEDLPGGALVLAVNEPPGPSPLAFYKRY
jgi:hypothetical protein